MKLEISEKQLKLILSNQVESELGEQEAPVDPQPSAGTSDTQAGGQGYPEVGKWESGVTRGPGNQVGITKWSDVVGSTLQRSKGNPLKEQALAGIPQGTIPTYDMWKGVKKENEAKWINLKTPFGSTISIPKDSKYTLWKPTDNRQGVYAKKGKDGKPMTITYETGDVEYVWGSGLGELGPTDAELKGILRNNTLRNFTTKKDNQVYALRFKMDSKGEYNLLNDYYNKNGEVYDKEKYVDSAGKVVNFISDWGLTITQIAASIGVAFATGGSSLLFQALAQVIVTAPFAAIEFSEGDNFGGTLSLVLAAIPVASSAAKFGVKSNMAALKGGGTKLIKDLATLKTAAQVKRFYNALPTGSNERLILTKLLKQTPKELENVIGEVTIQGFKKGVANGKIVLEKIPFKQLYWWKDLLLNGVGGFGFAYAARMGYNKYQIDKAVKTKEGIIKMITDLISGKK
jgi:hypothetical protein